MLDVFTVLEGPVAPACFAGDANTADVEACSAVRLVRCAA